MKENIRGVKVHYTGGIRKTDYAEWFAQKILKGETPDVAMILSDDFDKLVSLGVIQNLDELIKNDRSFDTNKFYESALNIGVMKIISMHFLMKLFLC